MCRFVGLFFVFLFIISATISTVSAQAIKLYWADEFAGRVYKADPDGSNLETIISGDLLNSEEIVFGNGKVYWSDGERGIIQRANTDGTALETVVDTPEPGPLALDLGAGKLYWIDKTLNRIERANLDGTSPEIVQTLTDPGTSLTIDEGTQLIFWAEHHAGLPTEARVFKRTIAVGLPQQIATYQGTALVRGLVEAFGWLYHGLAGEVRRMDANGAGMTALYSGGVAVSAVAVDSVGSKLYWSDDGNWDITRSNLDGSNVEVLDTFARLADGIALDISNAKLFWTEERYIVRAELDGTGQVNIVARPSYFGVGFHDAIDRLYYSDFRARETYYAASDGTGRNIFWAGGVSTGNALAIHVDPTIDKVYWLDGGDRWLRKADPDGSNLETVMYLPGDAYDIALDLPSARVYWCGRSSGMIFRHNLDATGTTDTLYTGLNLPKGLTLDYTFSRVLWGEDNQIASGPINGGGPVTVDFTDPFAVIGMAWDEVDRRLYWADQLNSRVRRSMYTAAAGWTPPETIFHMGLEYWPGRVVLQYDVLNAVGDTPLALSETHYPAPNPFNPKTTIHFDVAAPSVVSVAVYDVRGRLVREIARDAWMPTGRRQVEWDGKDGHGHTVASGVYLYRIEAGDQRLIGKMVFLK